MGLGLQSSHLDTGATTFSLRLGHVGTEAMAYSYLDTGATSFSWRLGDVDTNPRAMASSHLVTEPMTSLLGISLLL